MDSTGQAKRLAEILDQPEERCAEALKRCKFSEEDATDYVLTNQDQPGEFWRPATPELATVQFERWGEKFEIVDEETLSSIVADCVERNAGFTDASFPPDDTSLFFNPEAARSVWKCHDCNKDNPLPDASVMETFRNEKPMEDRLREFMRFIAQTNPPLSVMMQQNPSMAVQLMLQSMGPSGDQERLKCKFCRSEFPLAIVDAKPSLWLRPADVRDDVTTQYGSGAPWKLIRDSVRADDVRQGAVGNCWFVGALSILAQQKPHLIHRLFPFEQEFSEFGVYLVRLCKDGLWRNVIVDDHFPCTRRKALCYTTAARRQLWVPLIEKAAAKLSGCYEGMHAGTLCEAFSLLTGFATDRELLRSAMSDEEKEILWARTASAHSEGFLVGLACAPKPASKGTSLTQQQLQAVGLQAPHAYFLLETRELSSGEKLVLLGNPWGDRSPSTWKGAWGNSSSEFRAAVKQNLLPAPANEVNPNGQFWMTWNDLLGHFATIEVCRTADTELRHEERVRGWLPAITGLGDVFEFETTGDAKLRIDLSLYQESHSVRESATGAVSTNVDVGCVVLDSQGDPLIVIPRHTAPEISREVFLNPHQRYTVVPLSFTNAMMGEHRKIVFTVRAPSAELVRRVRRIPSNADLLRTAVAAYCNELKTGSKEILPGIQYTVVKDSCGAFIMCENLTACFACELSVDAEESSSVTSTRGTLFSTDVLRPGKSMIVAALTPKPGTIKYSLSVSVRAGLLVTRNAHTAHMPPLKESEDSPEILSLHNPWDIARSKLIATKEVVNRVRDPSLLPLMMNALLQRNQDEERLYQEYVTAGINGDDARKIAAEEAEYLTL